MKTKRIWRKSFVFILVLSILGFCIVTSQGVHAAANGEGNTKSLSNKIKATIFKEKCFSRLKSPVIIDSINTATDLFDSNNKLLNITGSYPDDLNNETIQHCSDLLNVPSDTTEKAKYLEKLGYKPEQGKQGGTNRCMYAVFQKLVKTNASYYDEGSPVQTPSICMTDYGNYVENFYIKPSEQDPDILTIEAPNINQVNITPTRNHVADSGTCSLADKLLDPDYISGGTKYLSGGTWSKINSEFNSLIKKWNYCGYFGYNKEGKADASEVYKFIKIENPDPEPATEGNGSFVLSTNDPKAAIINIFGMSSTKDITNDETASLYQFYLSKYAAGECKSASEGGADTKEVNIYDDKDFYENCMATEQSSPDAYKAINNGKYIVDGGIGFDELISKLNGIPRITDETTREKIIDSGFIVIGKDMSEEEFKESGGLPPANSSPNSSTGGSSEDQVCFDGAGALGWVVCPVVKGLNGILSIAYGMIEEHFLKTDPDYLGESTEKVWGMVRDFANIVFVILLLIVIFSQLTGFGIDNYGIKRILPRLIIAALLVNFSLIICKAAVDLSNVIGVSIKQFLESAAGADLKLETASNMYNGAAGGIFTGVLIGVPVLAAVYANPALILSFLMTVLSCLLAVITLLVILTARQVGIVVVVILSPLAFVSYLLPNTSKLLGKWWSVLKGLLIAYPICSLMIGAGVVVSQVIGGSNVNDALGISIAMLVRVLPFFAIPTIIRRSLDALGSLGATINGLSNKFGNWGTNKIANSDGYKAAQKAGLEKKNRIAAGLDKNGQFWGPGKLKNRIAQSGFGRATGLQKLQAARVQQFTKDREASISAAAELAGAQRRTDVAGGHFESNEKYFSKKLEEARNKGSMDQIFAVLDQAKSSGMKGGKIAQMTRDIFGQEDSFKRWSAGKRQNFLQDFSNRYGDSFLKKDYEQMMWAANGGKGSVTEGGDSVAMALEKRDADGNLTASYAEHNISNSDLEDDNISSLSSARLSELIAAGKISQPAAQRVWSSNGSMDDANRLILGAFANNGTVLTKSDAEHNLANDGKATVKLDPETIRELTKAAARDVQVVNSVIPAATNPSGNNNGGTTPTNNQNNGGTTPTNNQNNGGPIPKPDPRKGGDNNNGNKDDGGGSDHDTQSGTQNNGGKDDSDKWGHGYNDNDRDDGLM